MACKPWTEEEERLLKEAFSTGVEIPEIAGAHKRTVRAIEARLQRLGLITFEQRTTSNAFMGESPKDES
jgi:hypothetical protein